MFALFEADRSIIGLRFKTPGYVATLLTWG